MVRQDKQKRPDRKQNYDQAGCAPDRTRTCNLGIRRPLLYPLSYGGSASDQPQRLRRRNPSLPAPGTNAQRCHLRAPNRADRVQMSQAPSIIHHRRRALCTQAPRTQKKSAGSHPPRHFPHTPVRVHSTASRNVSCDSGSSMIWFRRSLKTLPYGIPM